MLEKSFNSQFLVIIYFVVFNCNIAQQVYSSDYSITPLYPSKKEIDWVRDNSLIFKTVEPEGSYEDLLGLKEMIGNARIVAIGEGTHGTSEFFKMKHRIIRFLIEEMDFSVVAIEAPMPEAKRVNSYVLTGKGDPKKALFGLNYWTWNTQEVLDMIEWMKNFNTSGKKYIEFWGFDLQHSKMAIKNVQNFVQKADSNYFKSLSEAYERVKEAQDSLKNKYIDKSIYYREWYKSAKSVLNHLQNDRGLYLKKFEETEVDWIIQNARIVAQEAENHIPGKHSRDKSMAMNISWILAQKPKETKIVLWSHNGHVTKSGGFFGDSMGKQLYNQYGNDLKIFGFAFHQGKYTAKGGRGFRLGVFQATPSKPGTVEWVFHKTGEPRLILDLGLVSINSPESNWMKKKLAFRGVGSVVLPPPFDFTQKVITNEFDALIFIDQTTPSVLLKH